MQIYIEVITCSYHSHITVSALQIEIHVQFFPLSQLSGCFFLGGEKRQKKKNNPLSTNVSNFSPLASLFRQHLIWAPHFVSSCLSLSINDGGRKCNYLFFGKRLILQYKYDKTLVCSLKLIPSQFQIYFPIIINGWRR